MQFYLTEMNSRYFLHCNGIFVNNYLLTGNKVQRYFTEMNSRFFFSSEVREIIIGEFIEVKERLRIGTFPGFRGPICFLEPH